MKTSFYFFLWFVIYYLIELTGSSVLIQNSFVVALIAVIIVGRLERKIFAGELIYQVNLNRAYLFEIFYSNDVVKMTKIVQKRCLGQTVSAIYCILVIASLLAMHRGDIFAYFIFGVYGIMMMTASSKSLTTYRDIKANGLPAFSDSQFAADGEAYLKYCELRKQYSVKELQPQMPPISKWANIASILFAVACIGGGLIYMLIFFWGMGFGLANMFYSALFVWGFLAVYFGFKDLISSILTLQKVPTPTLK